jgi:23S rRNA pseudouridine1911/1915/1917 synthase
MSSEGHPILGDELYGGKDERAERQLLHSYKISYIDPETKNRREFQTNLPKEMQEIIDFRKN